jgi:hypothetical protein
VTLGITDLNPGNNTTTHQTTVTASGLCATRPPVQVTSSVVGSRLRVIVRATGNGNFLQEIRAGTDRQAPINALIDLPDGRTGLTGSVVATLAPIAPSYTFYVRRIAQSRPTMVPLVILDGCGAWETFVGGGTRAGF